MSPKKKAHKRTAEDSVPELGTPKGPRLAYTIGEGKRSGEDPEGEEERGSPGGSGSAGSVAETEKRPAECVAERLRLKEQKAWDAAASGSSTSRTSQRKSGPTGGRAPWGRSGARSRQLGSRGATAGERERRLTDLDKLPFP